MGGGQEELWCVCAHVCAQIQEKHREEKWILDSFNRDLESIVQNLIDTSGHEEIGACLALTEAFSIGQESMLKGN